MRKVRHLEVKLNFGHVPGTATCESDATLSTEPSGLPDASQLSISLPYFTRTRSRSTRYATNLILRWGEGVRKMMAACVTVPSGNHANGRRPHLKLPCKEQLDIDDHTRATVKNSHTPSTAAILEQPKSTSSRPLILRPTAQPLSISKEQKRHRRQQQSAESQDTGRPPYS
jgi:hypothetical protein